MSYLSLADFKLYYDDKRNADDVLIQQRLDAAQQFIDSITHRTFETGADVAMLFDPRDSAVDNTLFLSEDLASITEVQIDSVIVPSSEYTTVPLNDTPFYQIKLRRATTFNWFVNADNDSVSVEGDWVYSEIPPADIVESMQMITTSLLKELESIGADMNRNIMSPTGVVLLAETFPKKVMLTLNHYRRRSP